MADKTYRYSLEITMPDPVADTPIFELVALLQNKAEDLNDRILNTKALAINTKWYGLCFLRAEIKALDKAYAGKPALRVIDKSLIISKIESFLTTARAILDIFSHCILTLLSLSGHKQSFNDLRKRQEIPEWLSEFLTHAMRYDASISMAENGWLLNLVTDNNIHGKSLRDFVSHAGTADLHSVEQFDSTFLFAFKPRESDQYYHHVEDMLDNVYQGTCELFQLVLDQYSVEDT